MPKNIFVLFFTLLFIHTATAADVLWNTRLEGSAIQGGSLQMQDGNFSQLAAGTSFVDVGNQSFLRLGLKEEQTSMFYNGKTMRVRVGVNITPYSNTGVAQTSFTQTLEVIYSANGTEGITVDAEDFRMPGVHKFIVQVQSVNIHDLTSNVAYTGAIPNYVYLEAGFSSQRYYTFNATQIPDASRNYIRYNPTSGVPTISYDITSPTLAAVDELELTWEYVAGAEYYDLEWTWVDNYDATGLGIIRSSGTITMTEQEFAHNSTRIRTSSQSYRLPNVFGRGYVIFRVRGVGRWANNVDKDKLGRWSSENGINKIFVNNWPDVIEIGVEHDNNRKNWQSQTTYAEEGKKKEVVQYFDGSLRGRQTVTRINSDNKSVVGETIYDNEGRGAVQILPVPQANPAIKYYDKLNNNNATIPYSHRDFDWEDTTAGCVIAPAGIIGSASGAGNYYSTVGHTADTDWQKNVPDAAGYPFTQVEYTPDNTGRIRRQSGVGTSHKIGSGKETMYYYLQPSQEELNRLFGFKAGYKARYKKNMVVDANGQVSVSYLDAQGRVVATALAGNNPAMLDALPSAVGGSQRLTTDLLNKINQEHTDSAVDDNIPFSSGRFGAVNDGLRMSTQLGVIQNNSLYDFAYDVKSGYYRGENCENQPGPVFPYVYDLRLSLRDDCGTEKFSQTYTRVGVEQIGAVTGDFKQLSFNNVSLQQGSYTLVKEISINEAALERYQTAYLTALYNPCLLDTSDFVLPVSRDCNTTCEECAAGLGTLSAFLEGQRSSLGVISLTPSEVTAYTNIYNAFIKECMAPCQVLTSCEAYEGMLRSDLRPLGQYGSIETADAMSVFNTSNSLGSGKHWRLPAAAYADEYGNASYLTVQYDGTTFYPPLVGGAVTIPVVIPGQAATVQVLPQALLEVSDFIAVWQDSWSLSLLPFHPEYKLYQYQTQICSETVATGNASLTSEVFDAYFRDNVDTYLKATGNNTFGIDFTDETSNKSIMNVDPFFRITYPAHAALGVNALKIGLMDEALTTNNYDGKSMTMLAYAVRTVLCGTDLSGSCNITAYDTWLKIANTSALTTAQKDAIWNQYKFYYLSYKMKINQLMMDFHGFSNGLYNGCIGNGELTLGIAPSFGSSTHFGSVLSKVTDLWGLNPGPAAFPASLCSSIYNDKQIRMVRIDNLYNSSLPQAVVIGEQVANANHAQWQQTGLCPMTLAMERLLDNLGRTGRMTATTNSNELPELTLDLYGYLTGVTTNNVAVNVTGTVSAGSLQLSIGNINGSCSVTLPQVGPYSWSNYNTSWKIWGIYHSYPLPGTNNTELIIKAGATEATAVEYVVTYSSCKNLNDCQAAYAAANNAKDASCDKEERFESALLKLLQTLLAQGKLHSAASLSGMPEYTASDLVNYLGMDNPSWEGNVSNNNITAGDNRFSLGMDFPSNTVAITGIDLVGTTLYVQYVTGGSSPAVVNLANNWDFVENKIGGSALNFSCACKASAVLTGAIESMYNHLIGMGTVPNGYVPPMISIIGPYLETSAIGVYNFTNEGGRIGFALGGSEGNCISDLSVNRNIGPILSISNLQMTSSFQYTATGHFAGGVELQLTGNIKCLNAGLCDSCYFAPERPVSCNTAYSTYLNAVAGIVNADFTPVSEADFCNAQYAYISAAYAAYISGFNIVDSHDPLYLSLASFGATPIGYSNQKLLPVVSDYRTYLNGAALPSKTWNEFLTPDYLKAHSICPALTPALNFPDTVIVYPCDQWQNDVNTVNGHNQMSIYRYQLATAFTRSYIEKGMSSLVETFHETHDDKEYHYTLYYYDRAGNLVQTVPPKGIDRLNAGQGSTLSNDGINALRLNSPSEVLNTSASIKRAPEHTLETIYSYNSLNQLVFQKTPDGGESRFAYDLLGRLVVSQNAKQRLAGSVFSYTLYDALGRVTEAGEFTGTQNYTINEIGRLVYTATPATEVDVSAQGWISSIATNANRREVTMSIYDRLLEIAVADGSDYVLATSLFSNYSRGNSRNRIVATIYQQTYSASFRNNYKALSLYDYDVHGNVKELIQVNADARLLELGHHVKKMLYDYDLVSGNVKQVTYQKGKKDQFIHKYSYDADNRITQVETSSDGIYFEKDAKYFYYAHGPLARTEIGDKKVQAQDYAYTIQGWLKTVNGEELSPNTMLGYDGKSATINSQVARDAYGYSLNYFQGDYVAANTSMLNYSASNTNMGANLYNGNIRTMITAMSKNDETNLGTHKTNYKYDQLNRIKAMDGYQAANNAVSGYKSTYVYDANGNLRDLSRYGKNAAGSSVQLDQLSYNYESASGVELNRLGFVSDAQGQVMAGVDLPNQSAGNYVYDAIGQLTKDVTEGITDIKWTVTNKVKEISYGISRKITFDYDAMGNRIAKHAGGSKNVVNSTFYVLDAQGNPMSTYTFASTDNKLYLSERNIYGSSRIGLEENYLNMPRESIKTTEYLVDLNFNSGQSTLPWAYQSSCNGTSTQVNVSGKLRVTDNCFAQHDLFITTIPGQRYEFSADFDITAAPNFQVIYYDNSCGTATELRLPVQNGAFRYAFVATTNCSRISFKNFGIDNGGGTFVVDNVLLEHWLVASAAGNSIVEQKIGDKRYELANHLGNVLNVVTDRKLPVQQGEIVYSNDFSSTYAPFESYDATLSLVGGRLQVSNVAIWGNTAITALPTVPGQLYRVTFSVDLAGQGGITPFARNMNTLANVGIMFVGSTGGPYTMDFIATSNTTLIGFESPVAGPRTFFLDDVSIRKVVTLMANEFGSTYAPFAPSQGVTLSLNTGRLQVSNVALWENAYIPYFPTVPGKTYRVNFTADLANAGRINGIAYASSAYIVNIGYTASGTYAFDFTATSNSTKVWFESAVAGPRTFYLDNVSIEDLNPSVDYYTADVVSYSDYYPFGMQMPGRNGVSGYRYGFNGMESDNEVKGNGNSYDLGARMHDPRIGRFFSVDALAGKFAPWSPYVSFKDNPIYFVDIDGNEATDWFVNKKTGSVIFIKGDSKVTQEKLDKLGSPYSPNDYERLGDDNMFGSYVNEFSMPNNILDKEVFALQFLSENFMESYGYQKGERLKVQETMNTTGGRMGNENVSSTQYSYTELDSGSLTYMKRGKGYEKQNVETTTTSGLGYSNTKVNYSTIVPYGKSGRSQPYFGGNQLGDKTKSAIEGIGIVLELIDLIF